MLLTLTLGFTTAISLSYFNSTKLLFWKRILIILLIFNFILLVEGVGVSATFALATESGLLEVWSNLIYLDSRTFTFLCLIFVSGICILVIPTHLTHISYNYQQAERYLFILTILLGGILLISSVDLLTIFLGLELQSYSVYLLAASYKNYEPSESAGLKYFLLGALSSTFILMGFILFYVYSGTTNLTYNLFISADLSAFVQRDLNLENNIIQDPQSILSYNVLPYIALLLVFIGVSWKLAAAPLHAWSIDVYDAVPGRLTAILSLLPKIGLFSFIVKLLEQLPHDIWPVNYVLQDLLLSSITQIVSFIIILSLLLGSILGLMQSRIKRLLAYSSVLNVGFIFMAALLTTSQYSNVSTFYVLQYVLTTVAVWICLTNLSNKEITLTSQLQGLFKVHERTNIFVDSSHTVKGITSPFSKMTSTTISATCLTLLILSTAGIPPMAGFFAKYEVILLSVQSGYFTLALLAVLASLISTVYYLNIVKNIWFKAQIAVPESYIYGEKGFIQSTTGLHTIIASKDKFGQSTVYTERNEGHILILLSLIIVAYALESNVVSTFLFLA